jgi:hypothetical protein
LATSTTQEVVDPALEPVGAACQNCGAGQVGPYCHLCGQAFAQGRLSLRRIAGLIVAEATDLDRSLLLTVRRMTVAPGNVIREYVAGRRQRYLSPLKYLVMGVALSLLVWTLLGGDLVAAMKAMVARSFDSYTFLSPAERQRLAAWQIDFVIPYQAQISVFLCLPFALLTRLFFRKSGYNLAEHLVFALFASAQVYIVDSVVMLALIGLKRSVETHTLVTCLIFGAVFVQAALGFFGPRFGTAVKALVALILSYCLLFVGLMAGSIVAIR